MKIINIKRKKANFLLLSVMLVYVFPVQNLFASQEYKSFLNSNNSGSNMAIAANEYSLDRQNKGYRNFNEDTSAGLYYLHARYYDPNTRQFLTKDPARMKNLYGYCVKDPLDYSDPKGQVGVQWIMQTVKEVAGSIGGAAKKTWSYIREDASNFRIGETEKRSNRLRLQIHTEFSSEHREFPQSFNTYLVNNCNDAARENIRKGYDIIQNIRRTQVFPSAEDYALARQSDIYIHRLFLLDELSNDVNYKALEFESQIGEDKLGFDGWLSHEYIILHNLDGFNYINTKQAIRGYLMSNIEFMEELIGNRRYNIKSMRVRNIATTVKSKYVLQSKINI
jgi:RHS repeat-associated protein